MSELDKIAGNIARDLDAGDKSAAATLLSQQYASIQREDFLTLVKAIDSQEKDGKGYDMAVKIGADGTPQHYALLPENENASAKSMASLMDEGKVVEAKALMDQVMLSISQRNGREVLGTNGDFRLWAKAVDSYEKDGIGHDINIDVNNPDITCISWSVNAKPEDAAKQLGMSDESLDIPALSLGKADGDGDSVS